MDLEDLGGLDATMTAAQPTTPLHPETAQNGAPRAPGTPFGQALSAQPLELAPAVCGLLERGLEASHRHLLLAVLQQCGRDLEGVRWRLVVDGARLVPEAEEG